jgi:F0F1-type ATP synthase assembly protein I
LIVDGALVTGLPEDRSIFARAAQLVSSVTSIALEMVLPILAGYWIDRRLGTKVLFTVGGAVLGLVTGMWSLLRMTAAMRDHPDDRVPPDQSEKQ